MVPAEMPAEVFCPECGYDLRGIPEGCCPECGFRYERQAILCLNESWYASCIAQLHYAVALQIGLLATIVVLRLAPASICVGAAAFAALLAVAVMRLVGWWLDVAPVGAIADFAVEMIRATAPWLVGAVAFTALVAVFERGGGYFWTLALPLTAILFGLLTWRRVV